MAKRMIQAMAYCHKADVVHRDLKPENYVFETNDDDSEMKLIDFGCAKLVDDETIYTDMAGTPYYIAPEVLDPAYHRTGKVRNVFPSNSHFYTSAIYESTHSNHHVCISILFAEFGPGLEGIRYVVSGRHHLHHGHWNATIQRIR